MHLKALALRLIVGCSLLLAGPAAMAVNIPTAESNALLVLQADWHPSGWTGAPSSSWPGLTCDVVSGHVKQLLLNGQALSGTLPVAMTNFVQLQYVDLSTNQLTGSFPTNYGSLTNLQYLALNNNQFTGSLPGSLSNCVQLQSVYLGHNQFTGSIPAGYTNLVNLLNLGLDDNQLSGNIPGGFDNCTQLQLLYLQNNLLTGNIPASLQYVVTLRLLDVSGNQLIGDMPVFNLISGATINVYSNYLNVAAGSQGLANINATISVGNAVNYLPQDPLPTLGIHLTSTNAQLTLTGLSMQSYIIQASSNLMNWITLTNLSLVSSNGHYMDASSTTDPIRFYRVMVP